MLRRPRLFFVLLAMIAASAAHAIDRSACKQYGGETNCWMPAIGPWKYGVCGEVGAFTSYSIAVCQAQGGTWNGSDCVGLPAPEYLRPTSEADMQPFAVDTVRNWKGPFCEGPTADGYAWGGVFYSANCWGQANGAGYTQGYESSNFTTPFAVHGVNGSPCTTQTSVTYSGSRSRPVACGSAGGHDYAFTFTTGSTPGLCSLGIYYYPVDPKQDCETCKAVGNPIDPASGNKRQVEVDYAGTGPQPLRFERVYNSRIFSMDGRQWRHNYSAHMENQEFGAVPTVAAHRPSGRLFLFRQVGGTYLPDTDIDDRVTRLTDAGGALTGWQYYDAASDSTELYDAEGKLLSITNRSSLSQTLEYSTAATPPAVAPGPGFLITVTDAFGRQLNFTYDPFGRLASMQDPAGQSYVYESTTQNHFASVTYPDGKTRTYVYNEPDHIDTNYYEGRLTGIIDENNSRYSDYYYNLIGFATRTTHAGGADNYVVNPGSWPASVPVTDPLGTVRTYAYNYVDGAYRLYSITQPAASGSGNAVSMQNYDSQGNVIVRRDFNNNRTNYTYDLSRNLETSRTEGLTTAGGTTPQTRTISTQWDAVFRLPTGIAEPLRITTNAYDPDGSYCGARGALCSKSIQATTDANGSLGFGSTPTGAPRTWTYTYNANGSVLTANGPRTDVSDITTYAYYANDDPDPGKRGNLATITNALGHVTEITEYSAHGQPLTIVGPNGLTTTLTYDPRLRLTSRTVGGELTSYTYDGVGQLTKVTLPDGSFLAYTYDAAHRLTDVTDALGNLVHYGLDAMGNRTLEQVKDPLGALAQTRSRVFNALNRLYQEIGAQNQTTQYAYDNQGNVTSVDGPLAGTVDVTSSQYDALNRLVRVTDPNSGQVNYGYNGLDRLTSVSDPRNLATTYAYDGLGDLNQQVSPDTGTTSNTYDSAGNLATSTDAKSQVTTYAYDALNRVTSMSFQDGSRQDYLYDQGTNGLGRLTGIREYDPQNTLVGYIDYAYDQKGRVISDHQAADLSSTERTTSYQYDAFGRLQTITYPYTTATSGGSVSYGYDGQGRVTQVSATYWSDRVEPPAMVTKTIVQDVTYQPFGGVKGFTYGDGRSFVRQYDQDGRVSSYTLGSSQYTLGYDDASRIGFISEVGNPANVNNYSHDVLDRLTQAVLPASTYGYSYDATGNRLTKDAGANTDTYAYPGTSNRLSSITPSSGPVRTYVHDAVGSVSDDGQVQYAYDARGRLVRASVGGCTVALYRVNALGQRVRKRTWPVSPCEPVLPSDAPQKDTLYTYDLRGHLIAESHTFGPVYKRAYLYLGELPVAMLFASDD